MIPVQFKVISIHFTRSCNLDCPFCYRNKEKAGEEKSRQFFIDLIPLLKILTPQLALGGGEPLLDTGFIKNMAITCKHHGLIFNFTTNGKKFLEMTDVEIRTVLQNVSMVSISFDYYKWGKDAHQYAKLIHRLKKITGSQINLHSKNPSGLNRVGMNSPQIGANILMDPAMFKNNGIPFLKLVQWLFIGARVDRVYALYPKSGDFIDILAVKQVFFALTTRFPRFYVDDLTKKIFEDRYPPWQHPCHSGKDILNIDECGGVSGCSFDINPILKLGTPGDLLQIHNISIPERLECPYFPQMH